MTADAIFKEIIENADIVFMPRMRTDDTYLRFTNLGVDLNLTGKIHRLYVVEGAFSTGYVVGTAYIEEMRYHLATPDYSVHCVLNAIYTLKRERQWGPWDIISFREFVAALVAILRGYKWIIYAVERDKPIGTARLITKEDFYDDASDYQDDEPPDFGDVSFYTD